jgi:hypothetical protein
MDPARRLELGQWFTPPALADLTLALALPVGAASRADLRLLDPACGDGVFLARARAAGLPAAALHGVELEPATAAAARARVPGCAIEQRDFFARPPGEFDVVVGNPPYVRQERLPPVAKQRVRAALAAAGVGEVALERLTGRGDLAAAFVVAALAALRPGGRAALVVSSALLDAGYADALWRVVAQLGAVRAIVEAPAERWFADAAVNAMILVLERGAPPGPVALARLTVPTVDAARRLGGRRLAGLAAIAAVREGDPAAPAAWRRGLRAPAAWLEIAAVAGPALRPLGALAEVRRGVTSGANDIFYLTRARAAELALEPALLAPLLRSPRAAAADRIAIDPDATPHVALLAPSDRAALERHPVACRYLDGHLERAATPSLAARRAWWSLPAQPARLFLAKAYHARFVQRLAPVPVIADQRLYAVAPRPGVDLELLAAALNGTFGALALESLGRASLGEGALEWTVADAAALPVVDPAALSPAAAAAARRALRALAARPIEEVARERAAPDRAALDAALAAAAPPLAALLPAAHDALCATVAVRLARARA